MSEISGPGQATAVTVDVEDIDILEKLVEQAEQGSRTDFRKKKTREGGRVDKTPDIGTVEFSKEGQPAGEAFKSAKEAERQARQIESDLAREAETALSNIQESERQLAMLRDNPGGFTIDGERVTGSKLDELQGNINRYKDAWGKYRDLSISQSVELKGQASETLGQISDWARNVADRNEAIGKQKAVFNQRMTQSIGIGSSVEVTPKLTKSQREFGITGIPGPGAGPAPGSFGEKLQQNFGIPASIAVKEGLKKLEAPFVSATTTVRTRAERLQSEAGKETASFGGLSKFLEGAALATGAAAFDAVTFGIRPGLAIKSAVSAGLLLTDPETQKAVVSKARSDPFTFTAEIAGSISGAALGAKLSDIGRSIITERGPIFRTLRAGGTPRQAFAVARRGTGRLDFNQLLKEEINLYQFPEEVIQPEFLRTFGPETTFEAPEIFSIQPFRKTQLFKPRLAGQLFAPKEVFVPSTIFRFKETALNIPSGRAAIPITIPQLGSMSGSAFASGVLSAFALPKSLQRTITPQVQRPGTLQQNLQKFNQLLSTQTRNILAPPKGISGIAQVQTQIQPQIQRQPTIQRQRLGITQIQVPQIPTITPPDTPFQVFALPPPGRPKTRAVLDFDPRKKKKKPKKGRKTRKRVEKRTTPLDVINFNPLKGIKR